MPEKTRITLNKWVDIHKEDWEDDTSIEAATDILWLLLDYFSNQGTIPALCLHGCEVELDGVCEHNNPSPLIKLGII